MTWTFWVAIVCLIVTAWALLKHYETRLVLLASGFFMACISLDPMMAFTQFDKSMTNANLIIAICSALGFAGIVSITGCDAHLVRLLTKPLSKMGVFLLPLSMAVTNMIAVAIPSMAGLGAAVGPTLIPILIRAGFKPAAAAGAIGASLIATQLSPGNSHNVFVAKMAEVPVIEFIIKFAPITLSAVAVVILVYTATILFYRDYSPNKEVQEMEKSEEAIPNPNIFYAIAPLLPVVILFVCAVWFPSIKLSVATAMLIGGIYAIAVTRTNPQTAVVKFFNGMGNGYGNIIGLIIAAGVFAAGLRAAGVIDAFVHYLTQANEVAKIGASIGPYVLGALTGSGDAAAFAFNEAVTPHAAQFSMTIENLGFLAAISAAFGRMSSPLAGGIILLSGIASVSSFEVVKRTIPAALVALVFAYFVL